ncbi:E3 ubiquitin-protein ligase MARCHF2-like isoform X2 [Onthophagus taurus]|uniref:E3 ubiquitin-protein ligase MARCHF2-like isoform X2 n=1 Tax=Onthophagus taurus TaxID=166361 RepID=UPI000C205D69|nr:E3 ubiquitin-protein ligase MARCH2-like isoform X2 [Onthophagus taurus]
MSATNALASITRPNDAVIPARDIVVSIILTESTASLLDINAIHLEDILDWNSTTSAFSLNDLAFLEDQALKKSHSFKDARSYSSDLSISTANSFIVTRDIAYFCNQEFLSESQSSIDESIVLKPTGSSINCQSLLKRRLLPCYIYTRPLLSAKTTAHEDKIKYRGNSIYLSIMDSTLTITSSGWVNFCRICHGGESVGRLISPCRCRGSIALAHLECLEEWLKQSNYSRCELCQHRYEIVREPTYSIPWSIIVFLTHPGERLKELLLDILGFAIYTPTAIASTYLLMVLCDTIAARNNLQVSRSFTPHFLAFSAVFGMATIDFTYSSWLVVMLQRHFDAWRQWYQNMCTLKVILPPRKQKRHRKRKDLGSVDLD